MFFYLAMTDYYRRRGQKWRREKAEKQGKSLFALIIVVILIFASVNGLLKSISFKRSVENSKWDGKVPFVTALGSFPASLFIYNPDTKNIIFLKFPDDLYFASGVEEKPLERLGDVARTRDGNKFSEVLSLNTGVKIENYLFPKDELKVDESGTQKFFKDFASITNPISILVGGSFKGSDNNVERYDALRLWWQVKGLRLNQIKIADFGDISEEVVVDKESKVSGVDTETLQYKMREILQSRIIRESGFSVKIINASGSNDAGKLAVNFVSSSGLEVISEDRAEDAEEKTKIISYDKSGLVPKYLARMFGCDIVTAQKSTQEEGKEKEITLFLGHDFANSYFK